MFRTTLTCCAAWLIPGGGHLFLKQWRRGTLFFIAVMLLFGLGLGMNGQLFGLTPGFFGFLKFFADASVGVPYFVGKVMGWGRGDLHASGYEAGNTYLYTAGLLNMLLVMDAFDIVQGRKR